MAKSSLDIDRIVREVIAQLGLGPDADAPGATAPGATTPSATTPGATAPGAAAPGAIGGLSAVADGPTPPQSEGDLVVTCRVVTLSEVAGRLEAVRRLVVPPQAVVTPAVRDELQRRNVTLASAGPPDAHPAKAVRLVLATAGKRFDATALIHALNKEMIEVEPHALDCLIAATDLLAVEVVKPDTRGLLLSRHPAAGLCLANRHRGVRAVSGTDVPAISAAAAEVGANLLVIDPAAEGMFQLQRIASEFCRGTARRCPEVFRQRLE